MNLSFDPIVIETVAIAIGEQCDGPKHWSDLGGDDQAFWRSAAVAALIAFNELGQPAALAQQAQPLTDDLANLSATADAIRYNCTCAILASGGAKLRFLDDLALRMTQQAQPERDLLRRIRAWDHLDTAGDGAFWKREIDALFVKETTP